MTTARIEDPEDDDERVFVIVFPSPRIRHPAFRTAAEGLCASERERCEFLISYCNYYEK